MKELFTAKDDPPVYAGIDDMCNKWETTDDGDSRGCVDAVTTGKLLASQEAHRPRA